MDYWEKKLAREQLDRKLEVLKSFVGTIPSQGWIRAIREALGLSTFQLGNRVGIDRSRISRLERAERTGDLKLSSLQKIARGLNMKFVYAFVPNETLESMVREQARRIALKRLETLDNTMSLERQGLSPEDKRKALESMIEKLLLEQPRDFWN